MLLPRIEVRMRQLGVFLIGTVTGCILGVLVAFWMAPGFGNNSPSVGVSMMLIEAGGAITGAIVGLFAATLVPLRTVSKLEQGLTPERASVPNKA